ncbi:MAG TPA: MlaD family protein [Abditibacteriaceae bacterium]|jgi:sporulation protein YlmC with PRC-barrel domain/predicted  nucleic acid-binding Zn-ribbon protein
MKNEARVGVVVMIALTLMVVGYFYLRGLGLTSDKYYLRLVGATRVAPGNEVVLQGVKIGQVQDVDLDEEQKPILTIAIKRGKVPIQLLKSYKYTVQSSALIGENVVDIRGPFRADSEAFDPNDPSVIIPVRASNPIMGVTDQATLLIGEMRGTLDKLNITIERINNGVLSDKNRVELARALTGVARVTESAQKGFGPDGIRVSFGDPRARQGLNDTLQNTALAARQAGLAAGDLRVMASDLKNIVGSNKGQVGTLLTGLNKTATEVAGLAESLSFLIKNGGLSENLNGTLAAARRAAENVEAMTANFKKSTGEGTQGDIQATLAAARRAAENVEAATAGLKVISEPETQNSLRGAIVALTDTANSLKDTAQALKTTLTDPDTQKQLKGTLSTINEASTSLAATAANLKDTSAGLKNVISDEKLQADLKALPGSLRASADELQKTLVAARGTAQSFQELADNVSGILPGRRRRPAGQNQTPTAPGTKPIAKPGANFPSGPYLTYRNLSDFDGAPRIGRDVAQNAYGDLGFDTTLFRGPLRLGISNIGDGSDLTLQTGRYLGQGVALRYGIYRSELGAGVELRKGRFFLESNAWDINDGSYNAIGGVRVTPQVELFAGRESIRGVRSTALGVRLRP